MNPPSSETSGIELPPPVTERAPDPNAAKNAPEALPQSPEAPAGAERAPSPRSAPPTVAPAIALPALPLPTAAVPTTDTPTTTSTALPLINDDGDLIEKEWVNKAKQIVERTRDDPHKQSDELTVVKADYMKKRYGKSIKLSQ